MSLGAHLYKVSKQRHAVALSLLLAVVACILTLYTPSLAPPGLHPRALQIGAASTQLLVAPPNLAVGGTTRNYESLLNQAILVGNVMVTSPVLTYVGHAIGVDPAHIQATAPMTANVPRALTEPGSGAAATDIIASPDQYRLEIQADPAVPILHVYAQAPSKEKAIRIAQAAVQGITTYLQGLESAAKTPRAARAHIQELGPLQAGVANPGAATQIAALVFLGVFGVSLWIATLVARIRRGWDSARLAEQLPS